MGDSGWRKWMIRGCAAAFVLVASSVSAQTVDTAPRMPVWDASGTIAVHYFKEGLLSHEDWGNWDVQWEPGVQVGRHLNDHLKFEFAARGPSHYRSFNYDRIPVPAAAEGFVQGYVDTDYQVVSLTPAMTWQFGNNSFVHPYVSTGVVVDVSELHRHRNESIGSVRQGTTTIRYTVPAIDIRAREVAVRPFLAAGSKSYFNQRWFVRPEIQLGMARSGLAQVDFRLGVGVDF